MNIPLPPIFRKLVGMTLFFYLDSHCSSAEEYSSLSFAAAAFTSLTLNAAKFFILFGRIKRQPQAWWSPEVKEAVSERRKVSLPLSEAMKIVRLTSPLPDTPRLSSPRLFTYASLEWFPFSSITFLYQSGTPSPSG